MEELENDISELHQKLGFLAKEEAIMATEFTNFLPNFFCIEILENC